MSLGTWLGFVPRVRCWRSVAVLGAAFIASIVGLTILDGITSHRATRDDAWRELDAQARVVAEQTARSLQAVDVVLRFLASEHDTGALAALTPDALYSHLKEQSVGLVQTSGVSVFNSDGSLRGFSGTPPDQLPGFNANIDHQFRALRGVGGSDLVFSDARFSQIQGQWVFPISRVLRTPSGAFDGTITALGRVDYFQHFYRDVFSDPGTRVWLLRRDTSLLAMHPPEEPSLGRPVPFAAGLVAAAAAGTSTWRMTGPADGVERLGATRVVPDYPLVVLVTRDVDVVFAHWRTLALRLVLRTFALASLAGLLLALTLRQIGGLDAARASLEVSQERYALAAAGSNEGLWDWDLAEDTLFLSPRAQEVAFGTSGDTLRPLQAWRLDSCCHPDDTERMRQAIGEHLQGLTPHFTVEFRIQHRSDAPGNWHWCRQRGIALRDAQGNAYRMAGSMEDITARKEAEAERERLEHQLRQAQKLEAIGTLAGGIAHDFNNILAAILGFGELARKDAAEGSRQQAHIDASLAAGTRAKRLVERILAFSRTGMGERVPVHVQSVVAEALDIVAATLPAGLHLVRHLEAGDAGLMGDPTQIHQVVMNLCTNAVQATAPPGTLTVRVDRVELAAPVVVATNTLAAGCYLRLAVSDTGNGIQPHLLERIFDPFFTTKDVGVGTGLGLSLVHGIVADLGGGIAVDSRPGEGSVFTVYLTPLAHVTPPAALTRPAPVPPGEGQTVLFVDDEAALVDLGEEILASLGYEAVAFSSSTAALAEFRAAPERFDLVLSDETMPGLTGCELAAEIRALHPHIPVVLMSGFITPAILARARDAGVAEVLAKPLDPHDIARCLAGALGRGLREAAQ